MKKIIFFALLLVAFSSCKDRFSINDAPDCLQEKIEAHKKRSYATNILTVVSNGERVYWFQDEYIDSGEDIINEKCEIICITDCECEPSPAHHCPDFNTLKWEIVWKK